MATLKVPELKVPDLHGRATDLGDYLREQRESARLSLRQLATAAGVSNPYLSQIERGLRKPSAEVLQQIAKGLQISAEALFLRAGLLEDAEGVRVDVAVHQDMNLTARQKRVLLDIYATFRAENARTAEALVTPDETAPAPAPAPRQRATTTRKTSPRQTGTTKRAVKRAAVAADGGEGATAKRTTAKRATAKRTTVRRTRVDGTAARKRAGGTPGAGDAA